jgi:AraC family L-rhamnose operon regulatory protein RhaS
MGLFIGFGNWASTKRHRLLGPHQDRALELVYVRNGTVEWDYAGRVIRVSSGHISFSWPWEWHGAANEQLPASDIYWIQVPMQFSGYSRKRNPIFDPALGIATNEGKSIIRSLRSASHPVLKISAKAESLFVDAVAALRASNGLLDFRSRALILCLLAEMFSKNEPATSGMNPKSGNRTLFAKFLEDLPRRCQETWTLKEMAAASGMKRTHFAQSVKELTGDTPFQLLNRHRINQAIQLLGKSERSVTEIAYECGFQSSQYFATVFRAFTGKPPSKFRPHRGA